MRVTRQPLPDTPIEQLVVADGDAEGLHAGQAVGFFCSHCWQSDETWEQIWHAEDCDLAGEHGRRLYDSAAPQHNGGPTPEIVDDHEIQMVVSAVSNGQTDPSKNEILGWRCAHCGNLDETLVEIRHDEDCELAGRFSRG